MVNELTTQEREEILARLGRAFEESAAEVLVEALDWVVARRAEMVTRQDLQGLQGLVAQLVDGQQALQKAVAQLTEAQARTEERLIQLAEAQARTEERVGWLEDAMTRLTEAQARTEERVGRLEDAMTRLTEAQTHLAEAQARSENVLRQLSRQVGGLSDLLGGDLEDAAYTVIHDVLKREFGWEVGVLERTWQQWDGGIEEINLFGQARDPAHPYRKIWIVGEAKHNLTLKKVERFAKLIERARKHLIGEIFPVCFCYHARPEVQARLKELGIHLVFSYGRMV